MAHKGASPITLFKNIYNNEFQWSVIKSFGIFLLGVRIAKELVGVEVMPAITPH